MLIALCCLALGLVPGPRLDLSRRQLGRAALAGSLAGFVQVRVPSEPV
jgi:hypothetical protein